MEILDQWRRTAVPSAPGTFMRHTIIVAAAACCLVARADSFATRIGNSLDGAVVGAVARRRRWQPHRRRRHDRLQSQEGSDA